MWQQLYCVYIDGYFSHRAYGDSVEDVRYYVAAWYKVPVECVTAVLAETK